MNTIEELYGAPLKNGNIRIIGIKEGEELQAKGLNSILS